MLTNRTATRVALIASVGTAAIVVSASLVAAKAVAAPSITSRPSNPTAATAATFAFSGSSGSTFQCLLDAGAFAACTSPKYYPTVSAGTHTFQVRAIAGADQSAAASYTWTIDLTPPPAPSITAKPAALSNTTAPTFSFTDTEAGTAFLCKLDAGAYAACSSPAAYSSVAQGSRSFSVVAKDAAGNVSSPTSYAWSVDSIAPPVPVFTQKPTDPTVGATQAFAWTDTEAGLTFRCSMENKDFSFCSSPFTYVADTTNNGQHQFTVRATDAAGNIADASYKYKIVKDTALSGVPFKISGSISNLSIGTWQSIPVTVANPNTAPIYVTALTVTPAADSTPGGCSRSGNVELSASGISTGNPLVVPAGGSVTLPTQAVAAPRIRLINLPNTNQDNCKHKTFALSYTGTAHN